MKCVALLTCEKVVIDKNGAHSLINVMITAAVTAEVTGPQQADQHPQQIAVPSNAVIPVTWWIYTLWNPSSEDVGKAFEQVYQVFWPNGDKLAESTLPFTQQNDQMQQTSFHIGGFPVGQQGKVRIVTWLHLDGVRTSEIIETYILMSHTAPADALPSAEFKVNLPTEPEGQKS
jgi:hypothetical protein